MVGGPGAGGGRNPPSLASGVGRGGPAGRAPPPGVADGYNRPPPGGQGGGYPQDGPGLGGQPPRIDIDLLPPGQDVGPGQKATDAISQTLAAITPGQMQDVMAGMKVSAVFNFHQCRGARLLDRERVLRPVERAI